MFGAYSLASHVFAGATSQVSAREIAGRAMVLTAIAHETVMRTKDNQVHLTNQTNAVILRAVRN